MRQPDPGLEVLKRAAADEPAAVAFVEQRRWQGAPACPHCGAVNVYAMTDSKTGGREKHYRWRCRDCGKQFSVRTGTIMEESRLPLRVWVFAFWRASASKKGISALQLSRELDVNYKSALFVLNRIRGAMSDFCGGPPATKLSGDVEVDETYVGGKPRNRREGMQGVTDKVPVFGAVQRGGDLRMLPVTRVNIATLGPIVAENVELSSRFLTDDLLAYRPIGRAFRERGHHTTAHSHREYARPGGIHSNTIESAFALLKRGIMGTFHNVSPKHLARYCDEFCFRWNTRGNTDAQRADAAIRKGEGKRLTRADVRAGRPASLKRTA